MKTLTLKSNEHKRKGAIVGSIVADDVLQLIEKTSSSIPFEIGKLSQSELFEFYQNALNSVMSRMFEKQA